MTIPTILSVAKPFVVTLVNLGFLTKPLVSRDISTGSTGKVSEPSRRHRWENNSCVSTMQQPMGFVQQLTSQLSCLVPPPPSTQPSCSPQMGLSEVSCPSWGCPRSPVQWLEVSCPVAPSRRDPLPWSVLHSCPPVSPARRGPSLVHLACLASEGHSQCCRSSPV